MEEIEKDRPGRNERCSCGGAKKYKKCCLRKDVKADRIMVFDKFRNLSDPRDNRGKRYELIDLIIMVIYGLLHGYEDFDNMAYFLKKEESYFKSLLLIEQTPSHDCLSDLFAVLDPLEFMDIFISWIREVVEVRTGAIVSLDGKAIKSARDKINGGNTPYILSAYLSEIGISIGQVEVGAKSSEFKSIPELLKIIDIKGCYITIDAVGTHETIARGIVAKGGHFALKVKGNQKILRNDITSYFNSNVLTCDEILTETTPLERHHGREEIREYYLSHDVSCITNKEKWDTVNSIGMVRVYRTMKDKTEINDHFYIMDTKITMEQFMKTTRSHWNIECGLHWRLDVILNEDRSRNRVGHSVSNLSIMRKIVFNLVRLDKSFGAISFKKRLTEYKTDFENIENLIFNVIPSVTTGV
jgi:predicted transposase YbfD/YdcC